MFLTILILAAVIPLVTISPWILSGALILTCGVYVAFEFALVKVSMRTLEREVEEGVVGATTLLLMKRDMNAMLAACQFGITVTSLGLTLALEPAIHDVLDDHFPVVAKFSAAIAMTIGALLHVTFGELVPKGLALVIPVKVLYATSPFMRMFRIVAVPFIATCNAIAGFFVRLLTGKNPDTDVHADEEVELDEALVSANKTGSIQPQAFKLMNNVLAFAALTAREVMTQAKEVVMLDLKISWDDNMRLAEDQGFSRYPVCDGNMHNVVGYVRRAEILKAELQGKRDLKALVLPIERRPETALIGQLNAFQGCPVIAVYDEHDNFTGLLTAEDVVEQIVGEIYDETDERAPSNVEKLSEGRLRIRGQMLLHPAGELLGMDEDFIEAQDVDTLGGYVVKLLARQPKAGDEVTINDWRVVVEAAQGFRVLRVLCTPIVAD
ncbi:MAG TPA: hemolysin family protein [Myxococcota bacterium]